MLTGYKTLLVASIISVLGAAQGLNWIDLLPDNKAAAGWIGTSIGIIMMVLRMVTNTTVTKATSPAPSPNSFIDRVVPK